MSDYLQNNNKQQGNQDTTKKNNLFKEVVNILFSVLVAYLLFILIRTFLFFPFQVSGNSMVPTMQDGDRLILNRLGKVDRFDVVVFPAPDPEGKSENEEYVKRVVGIPGDEIIFQDDELFVNGEHVIEHYLEPLKELAAEGKQVTTDFTLKQIPGSDSMVVPDAMYFVLGDNRDVSKDSRTFGFVPADDIEGTSSLRIWPLDRIGFLEKNE